MIIVAMLFVGSGLVLNVAAAVPTYNVKPTCRAAIDLSGVTGRTAEMCEASEAKARSEIVNYLSSAEAIDRPVGQQQQQIQPKEPRIK